ncbi:LuxR family transcriptional regulator [Streptomyces sp. NPDC000594]|uniref:helix-turn-helix transcriptional regulator n=1 Tax=Streptomyces sp. NPDC000594 TaxID=3154261 RepID=UPI003319E367
MAVAGERDTALAEAARCAAEARAGRGGWLLLHGDTGSGRTALLEEIVRRETGAGPFRPLRAHAAPGETRFAFALIRRLLAASAVSDALPFAEPTPAAEQRLFHGLMERLTALTAQGPVLLAVDDLHLADGPSLRWLGYLTHRLAALPVLLVLTTRTRPGAPAPGGRDTGLHPDTGTDLPLPPLDPGAVARLLAPHALSADLAELAATAGAGNPMLLRALTGRPVPRTPRDLVGDRYRAALDRWLRNPAAPERRPAALALALLLETSAPTDPALVTAVAGLPPELCATALSPAGPTGLTAMLAPAPVRESVLATAVPAELRRYRRRLARALYERGTPAPDVAEVLLRTPHTGDAWITRTLDEAADDALRQGRTDRAARLLRHALTGPADAAAHLGLTLRLSALDMFGSARAGTRRLQENLQGAECPDPHAVASALGGALAAQGRIPTAIQVLGDLVRTPGGDVLRTPGGDLARTPGGDPGRAPDGERSATALRLATARFAAHDAQEWHRAARELRELTGTAPPDTQPLIHALLTLYEGGTGRIDARTTLDRATALAYAPVDPRFRDDHLAVVATLLRWADRPDESRALIGRGLPAAPLPPDLTSLGHQQLLAIRTALDLAAGRFAALVTDGTRLLERTRDPAVRLPHLRALTALAHHELGLTERARHQLHPLDPPPGDTCWTWDAVLYARARLHLDTGRWDEALTGFLACGARTGARGFTGPLGQPWRSGAVLALARLGRRPEAHVLSDEELRHAHAWGTPRAVGTALRSRAAALGGRPGLDCLTEAVALLRTAPAPVELIEALTDLGRAQRASGHTHKARTTLTEALGLARDLTSVPENDPRADRPAGPPGAPPTPPPVPRLLAGAQLALRTCGAPEPVGRTAPAPLLTRSERRIVDLAVQGFTNAQICASLHLARRTVETHLTQAYRKLGISRRTQLATRLGGPVGQ